MALTAQQEKLAQQARQKAAGTRTPEMQRALEAARAAGLPGFRSTIPAGAGPSPTAPNRSPVTGLNPGVNPKRALAGTYRGIELPKKGISAMDLPDRLVNKLETKRPDLYKKLQDGDLTALQALQKENPQLFKQIKRNSGATAYGAEQGIYGPKGYQDWMNRWNKTFRQAGMNPIAPDEWARLTGYNDLLNPGKMADNKRIVSSQRRTGAHAMAGSNPFDYVPRDDAGKLRVLNAVLGTTYGSLDEMERALGPSALWGAIGTERQRMSDPNLFNYGMGTPGYLRDAPLMGGGPNASGFLNGNMLNAVFSRLASNPAQTVTKMRELVQQGQQNMPAWFSGAVDKLRAAGIPEESIWSNLTSWLGNPGVNLDDPTKPFLRGGARSMGSDALMSADGRFQAGLPWGQWSDFGPNAMPFLSSLSAQEFVEQVYPEWWKYHNDPSIRGDPNTGLGGDPRFMAGGLNPNTFTYVDWTRPDLLEKGYKAGDIIRSPMYDTPAYQRFKAYGQPGTPNSLPQRMRNPTAPSNFFKDGLSRRIPATPELIKQFQRPPLDIFNTDPQYFVNYGSDYLSQVNRVTLPDGRTMEMFGPQDYAINYENQPYYWGAPQLAGYAPWNTDPAALERLKYLAR